MVSDCVNCGHGPEWGHDPDWHQDRQWPSFLTPRKWGRCLHMDMDGSNVCMCDEWLSERGVEQMLTGQQETRHLPRTHRPRPKRLATIPHRPSRSSDMSKLVELLARAWEEGYEAGYNDGAAEQGMGWEPQNNQNPYEDRTRPPTMCHDEAPSP